MDKIYVPLGDFLKNAGIVGLNYLLEEADVKQNIDYGFSDDEQEMWLKTDFVVNTDWTSLYFEMFVKCYGSSTVYQKVLDKIDVVLVNLKNSEWDKSNLKDDLKYINDKLLSKSYKSGFQNIKERIDKPEIYVLLEKDKLKDTMEKEQLQERLLALKDFLVQPLCKETFSMKSIIYNYINRFWDGKGFLSPKNASKDMKEVFDADFSEPLKKYVVSEHKKAKDMCIDCDNFIKNSKERVSIAFMKDMADDLLRKKSAFWNCKVDAYLCPVCTFIYSLAPLGFSLIGDKFVFINKNENINELISANRKNRTSIKSVQKKDEEKISSWIAKTLNVLLDEKANELGNIQVIARGRDENDRYTFDIISKDVLDILSDDSIQKRLTKLSLHPYIKVGKEYWNIHEDVIMNILKYRNQYYSINKILRLALETEGLIVTAGYIYDIQLRISLKRTKDSNIGGKIMNRYDVRDSGYELRNTLLSLKGTSDDECLRGTTYQLLNALAVGNREHFMDIIMRIYCSTKLQVPNAFIKLFEDRETFMQYGYAFLLGFQGSHYKKTEKLNENI